MSESRIEAERLYQNTNTRSQDDYLGWTFRSPVSWCFVNPLISGVCKEVLLSYAGWGLHNNFLAIRVGSMSKLPNYLRLCKKYSVEPDYFLIKNGRGFVICIEPGSFWWRRLIRLEFLYMVLKSSRTNVLSADKFWENSRYNRRAGIEGFKILLENLPKIHIAHSIVTEREILGAGVCSFLNKMSGDNFKEIYKFIRDEQ